MPIRILFTLCTLVMLWQACGGGPATTSDTAATAQTIYTQTADSDVPAIPLDTVTDPAVKAKRTVLDYYNMLVPPYDPGYPLQEKNGKWRTRSRITEQPINAVVDIKNGYIEIEDEGTGGGTTTCRVVLFRMADGNPMIAITETFFDGVGLTQERWFLRPEDPKRWDWTDYTLRTITAFDFLPSDNAEEPDIVHRLLPVTIELPRQGTTTKAIVRTELEYVHCREGSEYIDYCGLYKQLKSKQIDLKWNREKGKFE